MGKGQAQIRTAHSPVRYITSSQQCQSEGPQQHLALAPVHNRAKQGYAIHQGPQTEGHKAQESDNFESHPAGCSPEAEGRCVSL